MKGTVVIGDKKVEVVANAASPYLYKGVFHEDFLIEVQKSNPSTDLFVKMGFIMAMQAAKSRQDVQNLNIDDFYDWLEEFDAMDILLATDALSNVYFDQTKGTAAPKVEAG